MSKEVDRLVNIVAKLRAPEGCPWDREQNHKSILPDLLDEVYEFFESVDEEDDYGMREELGDLLLQVVFHSQLASEENKYNLEDVAKDISDKLVRRHPHVFGEVEVESTGEVLKNWEDIKRQEKGKEDREYVTDGIAKALPALFRAEKIQKRVARVGFDWKDEKPVLDKVEEEFLEFREALEKGDIKNAEEELGDIIFALVNVARHNNISAETALRLTIEKFDKRFRFIEDSFKKENRDISKATLEELDKYWEEAKKK